MVSGPGTILSDKATLRADGTSAGPERPVAAPGEIQTESGGASLSSTTFRNTPHEMGTELVTTIEVAGVMRQVAQ